MVGDRFNSLYVLHSGSAKSYVLSAAGEHQITGFHLPGELIGVDDLAANRRSFNLEMLETSSVCELPMDELDRQIAESSALRHRFLGLMGLMLTEEKHMLLTLGAFSAEQRFAYFLLSMSRRYGILGASTKEFNLSMPRNDIANYLGLVVETVSRIIRRFKDENLIEVQRRWIRILDHDKLCAHAKYFPEKIESHRLNHQYC
jgi:CRP/FNR family transcriptional regulator